MVLDAEKFKIKVSSNSVSGEVSLLGLQTTDFSLCPQFMCMWGERKMYLYPLIRAQIPS